MPFDPEAFLLLTQRLLFGAGGAFLAFTVLHRATPITFMFLRKTKVEREVQRLEANLAATKEQHQAVQDALTPPVAPDAHAAERRTWLQAREASLSSEIARDEAKLKECNEALDTASLRAYTWGLFVYVVGGGLVAALLATVVDVDMPAGVPHDAAAAFIIGTIWPNFLATLRIRDVRAEGQDELRAAFDTFEAELARLREARAAVTGAPGAAGAEGAPRPPAFEPPAPPMEFVFARAETRMQKVRERTLQRYDASARRS